MHLVRHRTALNRIHATLLAFGNPGPVADLFGLGGREMRPGDAAAVGTAAQWASDTAAALHLLDELDADITRWERALRRLGADHRYVPYVPLLVTASAERPHG